MKKELWFRRLLLPILVAFILLTPLLGAAVVGEHRYAVQHPAYAKHMMARLLREENAADWTDDWSELSHGIPTGGDGGVTNILVMGRDAAAGLTDVMMLVSLDADAHTLQVLQIPRDTYVKYTSKNYKKINGAYRALGGVGLSEFISHHMGIDVDGYVCMDLSVFGEVVDTIGGVPMDVPSDMDYDDPAQSLHIHLNQGKQCLTGQQAQMFVRFRSGYAQADLGRIDAQKLFLAALAKQVKTTLTVPKAVELACTCFGKVKTSLSLRQCISCVRALMEVQLSDIQMTTLIGEAPTPVSGGAWYYILNRNGVAEQLSALCGGVRPFDPEEVFTDRKKEEYQSIYLSDASRFHGNFRSAQDLLDGTFSPTRIS